MSEVKVNKISPRSDCGTVTLGDSGDTFTIPSGATITNNGTQTGFGRTGTVDWDTSIKTGTVTAVSGSGYFVNTTSGGITVNLPAAAVGSIVAVSDYASTWGSNNLTISPNGTDKINGVNDDATLSTSGLAVTLVYADATRGWKSVTGSDADATGVAPTYVVATGGSPCTGSICGDYKTHSFTGPGTLTVSCAGNARGNNKVDYLVIAGGGSGGSYTPGTHGAGGGGGGGGFRESKVPGAPWTASPIVSATSLILTATPYPITVGGGGAAAGPTGPGTGIKGNDSIFSTITSTGGGYGGHNPLFHGGCGGSGGGGGGTGDGGTGGAGNTPVFSPAQGFPGGDALTSTPSYGNGGGGGATEAGADGTNPSGSRGGAGATTCISESPVAYSGGGGGASYSAGGVGAGSPCGTGGAAINTPPAAEDGDTNKGGGGGGHGTIAGGVSGAGGSGVVVIRYKFQ